MSSKLARFVSDGILHMSRIELCEFLKVRSCEVLRLKYWESVLQAWLNLEKELWTGIYSDTAIYMSRTKYIHTYLFCILLYFEAENMNVAWLESQPKFDSVRTVSETGL